MTIARIGATQKYANGWEQAFGKGDKIPRARASLAKATRKSKVKPTSKSTVRSTSAVKKSKKARRRVK
jgi:hypothetical protein